ncbi:MAG TPA: S9 family peptidase, partial [Terricaulis sp.]|nr:S9 family peptidase [Terricaulis sp.]
ALRADVMASDPSFRSAALSPDGRYVVGIRSDARGDTLIRLDWRTGDAAVLQQVTRGEIGNQIDWVEWKGNDRLIMSVSTTRSATMREVRGAHIRSSEQVSVGLTRIVTIGADGGDLRAMFEGQTRNLAWGGASTVLVDGLPHDPDHVLIAAWGASGLGLYRGNIHTGRTERLDDSGWEGGGWATDGAGNAVLRYEMLRGGAGYRVLRRAPGERGWTRFADFRGGEATNNPDFGAFAPGPVPGQVWVYARPEGHDKTGLYLFDAATGQYGDVRYEHANADFGSVWITRDHSAILAACAVYQRRECTYFDADVGRHIRAVNAFFESAADVTLVNMSADSNVWLVYVHGPATTPSYYIYDRTARAVLPVTAARPLTDEALSPTSVVAYASRDGASLWGYLTAPRNAPAQGAPLVVFPHGGPEVRDYYGFDREVQFYASRGYLVFQPQFRGSRGFGLEFAHAGRRQWGQRMQDDITDGVRHLIESGRVDPARICIVGHSYGGYAALAGATLTPDLYACAVGVNGVYDLPQMLRWEAQEGGRRSASLDYWRNSIGDPSADRAMLEAASPRQQVAAARAPILIVAADQDETVPVEQSRAMRDALQRAGRNFRYVEIPREGHSWYGWEFEKRVTLLTEIERFLAEHLRAAPR